MQILTQPEYAHVLLNPLPVYGVGIGVVVLCCALLLRNRPVEIVALAIIAVSSLSAWPVSLLGHKAHARLEEKLSADSNKWMQYHEETANAAVIVALAAALISVGALSVPSRKYPKLAVTLTILSLLSGATSLAMSGRASHAGGRIRHEEFRTEPPPDVAEPHHHHEESGDGKELHEESGHSHTH